MICKVEGREDSGMLCYHDMAVLSLRTWTCVNVENSHPNTFCKSSEWGEHGVRSSSSCISDRLRINIKPGGLCCLEKLNLSK